MFGVNLAGWFLHIPRDLFYTIADELDLSHTGCPLATCGGIVVNFPMRSWFALNDCSFKDILNSFKQKMKFNKI